MRNLSEAALASITSQDTDEVWLLLLVIEHAQILDGPLRFVNNMEDIDVNGDTYIAFPFAIDLPGEDPDQPNNARLRIDNVDRRIIEAIRGLTSPPKAHLRVVLASQPEVTEIEFNDLIIRTADYDALYIDANMTYEHIFTEPVSLDITPARFPGLF